MTTILQRRTLQELQPGDLVDVQNRYLRLRYITCHNGKTTLHFQSKDEPVSPFTENDVVVLSVSDDMAMWFNVELKP